MVEDRSFFLKVKMKFNSFPTWFVHLSKTSSVFQVSSLSESEESQDSSDSIGSSQKTHGILARRPSYRLVLMYQILCVLYYLMSLNGIIQSKLHQEGTCVCIRRHVLREIGLSQVILGVSPRTAVCEAGWQSGGVVWSEEEEEAQGVLQVLEGVNQSPGEGFS